MKIENHSSLPTYVIEALVEAVMPYFCHPFMARLVLEDRGKLGMGGVAIHHDTAPDRDRWAPSCIRISIGQAYYPRDSRYVLGPVHLESWQEEFVLTLAHELRHIDQFWGLPDLDNASKELERDAEAYALSVLEKWRSKNRRSRRKKVDTVSAHM